MRGRFHRPGERAARLAGFALLIPAVAIAEGLRPIRGPIVPGFWERNGHWAGPALVVAFLAVLGVALLIRKHLRRPRPRFPLAVYRAEIKEVRELLGRNEREEVPARLSRVLREYIEAATGVRAPEQTTEEFLSRTGHSAPNPPVDGRPDDRSQASKDLLPPGAIDELRPFLALADEAKFARRALGEEECRELMERADRFVAANEERMSGQ